MTWRRTEGFCDGSTVSTGDLVIFAGRNFMMTCRRGCSGSVAVLFQCTDFSIEEEWSDGQGSTEITFSGVTNFEAS